MELIQKIFSEIYRNKFMPLYEKLSGIMLELHEYIEECFSKEIPPRLKNMIWFAAETYMVVKGVESGMLKISANIEKSTMGMYFVT